MKMDWYLMGIFWFVLVLLPTFWARLIWVGISLFLLCKKINLQSAFVFGICVVLFYGHGVYPNEIKGNVFHGTVDEIKENYSIIHLGFEKELLVYHDDVLNYDDEVKVSCELLEFVSLDNRVGFSYEEYAKGKGIRNYCFANEIEVIQKGNTFRNRLYLWVNQFSKESGELFRTLIFHQYQSEKDSPMGLLLSSGLHLSYFFHLLTVILGYWFEPKEVKHMNTGMKVFVGILFHGDYRFVRILLWDFLGYSKLKRQDRWGIWVILLTILYPHMGNQLAFLFPVAIQFIYSSSLKHSRIAMIALTIWLNLWTNGYVYLSSIAFVYLFRPLYSVGFVLCLLGIILPIQLLIEPYGKLLLGLIEHIPKPFGLIIGKPWFPLFVGFLFYFHRFFDQPKKRDVILCVCLFLVNSFQACLLPFPLVTFLDVGQGDSALIQLPFHQGSFLIDTGGLMNLDIGNEVLFPVYFSYGLNQLDHGFLSHSDFDHSGAKPFLMEKGMVKEWHEHKEKEVQIGPITIHEYLVEHEYESPNDNSLVQCFSIYGMKFLFTGDISKEVEFDFVKEWGRDEVVILKAPHHGSNTSSSNRLLEAIRPKMVIISSGKNNPFRHPSIDIIERYNEYRISYWNTAEQGAITLLCTPLGILMTSKKGGLHWIFNPQIKEYFDRINLKESKYE